MTEFPLMQKLIKEAEQKKSHQVILCILQSRFQEVPDDLPARVRRFRSEKKLDSLLDFAVQCQSLDDFQSRLRS